MMNKTTETRIRRLEQGNGAELVKWQFVELYPCPDDANLWRTARDGSDWRTADEHAKMQPAQTILVCLHEANFAGE